MRSLEEFISQRNEPLFIDATNLPAFFESNLIDPARVVKYFNNDPQANIRVFYYQYLKLCFQLQSVDFQNYISKIQEIINNQDFKFVFYQDDDPQIFSDLQFKHLITQFFTILGQGNTTVQECLNKYPIMDTVFIYFLRAILILTGKTQSLDSYIERQELLQFLCNYFAVEISIHDKCIKFVETDIFIYEEDPKEVYMAYMDYDKVNVQDIPSHDVEEVEQSLQENKVPSVLIPGYQNQPPPQNSSSRRGNTEINTSYISSQFVDYTHNNTNLTGLVNPNKLKESATIDRPQIQKNNIYMSANIEQTKPKEPSPVIIPPSKQPQTIRNDPIGHNYINTLTYSSQSNNNSYGFDSLTQKSGPQNTTGISQYSSSLSPNVSQPISKVEENKYQNQYKWESNKPSENSQKIQKYQYHSVSPFQKPSLKQDVQVPIYQPSSYQAPSTFDSYRTKQSSYTSSISETHKYQEPKPVSNEYSKEQISYQPQSSPITPNIQGASGKNAYNLNVSLEFTNSITMKAMSEPFKTNVRSIRQRARNYRDSLTSFLK